MSTDTLREAAAKAAREWVEQALNADTWLSNPAGTSFEAGYLAGYEAAKAEAAKELDAVWDATNGGSHD